MHVAFNKIPCSIAAAAWIGENDVII